MKNFIFLGAPGAGKGTMAEKLSTEQSVQHISTGAILREEIANGTKLGTEVKNIMASGGLVPDSVVANIIAGTLASEEVREAGFILDGFPRTTNQAEILSTLLKDNGIELDAVILFDVNEEILIQRLTGRRVCKACGSTLHHMLFNPPAVENTCSKCGGELYQREDDNIDTAKDRLTTYNELTLPLVDFYKQTGKLIVINAEPSQSDVFNALKENINA
ncbi:MAG: adenylate kinase [Lentisphaeria bacterium]|nr:adenylate kinase [Lentisphaeria bacterium]